MTADEVPIGRDPDVRGTLTHVIETVLGVFLGIAAGRVSAND